MAVEHGFSGTQEEWLQSLKGEKGEPGADGEDGKNFQLDYTLTDLYNEACANGFEGSFESFVKEFFELNTSAADQKRTALNNALNSVCNIVASYTDAFGQPYAAGGAGVFYRIDSANGDVYIITNYHVVYSETYNRTGGIAPELNAYLYGDYTFSNPLPCKFIGGTADYDVAVLKVENSFAVLNSDARQAVFADSTKITVGDECIAIGNPQSYSTAVTSGVISVDSEQVEMESVLGTSVNMRLIRFDAPVNPGNSGGGLFNVKGEVVGIVNAKLIEENYENIGYAIPANVAVAIAKNIIQNCDGVNVNPTKPVLGVEIISQNARAVYVEAENRITIIEDVVIHNVYTTSSLYDKLLVNDTIVSVTVNGEDIKVDRNYVVTDILIGMKVGDTMVFHVLRDGASTDIELTITADMMQKIN